MKRIFTLLSFLILAVQTPAQFKSVWDKVPQEVKEKNSFQRYEWFYRTRTDEYGVFPHDHVNKLLQSEMQKGSFNKGTTVSDQWTNIGPNGIDMTSSFIPYWGVNSGRVRGLDVHPTNPDIVYIGAAAGGIWKTTNGGTTWTDKSGALSRLTFGAIAIDANNPNTIYAGSGETRWLFNNVTFEGNGLYKSTDGGDNWTQITNNIGTQTQFSDIEVNPHNSNILLASLGSGNWNNGFPSNEGVWRSTNAGDNWTRTLNLQDAFDVSFHPSDATLAYACTGDQETTSGFYRSTDGGINWIQSNTGLPTANTIGRMQFELSPSSPSNIYALIYNTAVLPGGFTTAAFKSTNGGVNWSQISSGTNIAGSYSSPNVSDQGSYDLCLTVHPTDPNIACFGNVEISRTSNGSTISFVRNPAGYTSGTGAWDGYTHTDIHKLMFAPTNGNIVYVGCDGGVYKSTNAGLTFSHVNNNINTIQFYRLASHPTNSSILYGGAQDNGNYSTSDKGATNWVFETSGDGMECFVDHTDPTFVFMSTQNGSLSRSTNSGSTWEGALSISTNSAWVAPYWQHPTDPLKIYAALDQRIYRSSSRGASGSWGQITSAFTSNRVTSVTHSSVNTNYMMAIASYYTTSPGVYKSTDEGVTWSTITSNVTSSGFSGTNIQRVVADPVNANTFYITRATYSSGMVIKSTDFGVTWTNVSGNLPAVPVNDLFIDPANSTHLYAGNDFGVYWSSNGGTSWTKLSNGMPFVPVQDFSFYNNGGVRFLRAATHGRGVYELNIDSPLPVELSSFSAETKEDRILLKWTTATELNNHGFEVERSVDGSEFNKIAFIDGNGNSNSPREYSYNDKYVNGFLSYRLRQVDNNGSFSYSDIINLEALTINDFAVFQNYPNPFNPTTSIKFKLPAESRIKITITNSLGEKVESIFEGNKNPGIHEVVWDGSNAASGIYFANIFITSGEGNAGINKTIKMILNK